MTYDLFSTHFDTKLQLGSLYLLHAQIAKLSHVLEYSYDCCVNDCCCFVGRFFDLETCVYCGHQHLKSNGTPYQTFQYLPLFPHIKLLYLSSYFSKLMAYHSSLNPNNGLIDDVFNGNHY